MNFLSEQKEQRKKEMLIECTQDNKTEKPYRKMMGVLILYQ